MSKGSWYRPVDKEKYDRNYERIFGTKGKKKTRRTRRHVGRKRPRKSAGCGGER